MSSSHLAALMNFEFDDATVKELRLLFERKSLTGLPVDKFLAEAMLIGGGYRTLSTNDSPDVYLEKLEKRIEKVRFAKKAIIEAGMQEGPPQRVLRNEAADASIKLSIEINDRVKVAHGSVADLLDVLTAARDAARRRPGRPLADEAELGAALADAFNRHIERPTTTRMGIFADVVAVILPAIDSARWGNRTDFTRFIAQAIASLPQP